LLKTSQVPLGLAAAVLYAVGIPALFVFLSHHYKRDGRRGDVVVVRALAWTYEPFRDGKEWWLGAEMARVLLLTSTVGFTARTCHYKILAALVIALFFLVLFLQHHPCPCSHDSMPIFVAFAILCSFFELTIVLSLVILHIRQIAGRGTT
jgi:hypothetical protein